MSINTTIELPIRFDQALEAIERMVTDPEHAILLSHAPQRLRQCAEKIETNIAANAKLPPTCFECGCTYDECECN